MDNAQAWRGFFVEWPRDLPRRGVVVTSFNEQIVFGNFLTTDSLLLVERQTPDSVGGRRVIIPYGNILALKLVDPVKTHVFTSAGFQDAAAKP